MKTGFRRRATVAETTVIAVEPTLAQEEQAFRKQRRRLLRKYRGQFVALQAGKVIAHDHDDEALATRMFARIGDAPFYIARVDEEPLVFEIPSPELSR